MSDLEARLSRLETSNRRWKLGAMLLLGCGLLGAAPYPVERLTADGEFGTLICRTLLVKDSKGETAASIVVDEKSGKSVFKLVHGKGDTMLGAGLPGIAGHAIDGTPWKVRANQ